MKLYQRQFSVDLDQPPVAQPQTTILIASTPRCGSHMLGHAMAGTGCLGVPYEYANPANLAEWKRRFGTVSPEATFEAVMARRTTTNGVFAIKAHYNHCDALGGPEGFLRFWPDLKVVHITRVDVLRQAISYVIARQTGVWIDGQEAEAHEARYDPAQIADCLDDIAVQTTGWLAAFAAVGIVPLSVRYEDAVKDLSGVVGGIARHVGVGNVAAVTAATVPQARPRRSEDWIRRYATEWRPTAARGFGLGRLVRLVRS